MARRIAPLALATLTSALVCALPAAAATPTVRVGFGSPQEPSPLVGFVHGIDSVSPSDARIEPLRPSLWRGKLKDVPYKRAHEIGGRYTYVLSDRWGYPGQLFAPRAPYEDWGAWRRFVEKTARTGKKGEGIVWDIWNEPNHPYFWTGTKEQLYETYRIAWQAIHEVIGPGAVVSGPSTSYYSPEWIGGLLDYCRSRGCDVDALSWHEFPSGSIPAIETRLDQAHSRWVNNPAYASVGIQEVHLNEVIGAKDQYLPAETLGYMRFMERGGADLAARACWSDSAGADNCYNETLGGLLQPSSLLPRSVWWTTKAYADGAGSRVLTRFSDPYVVGIGSRAGASAGTAQLLIGHLERRVGTVKSRSSTDVRVTLRKLSALGFLRGSKQVKITIQGFPATGEAPLAAPVGRRGKVHRIRDGEVALTLHGVKLHEAYRLLLTRP